MEISITVTVPFFGLQLKAEIDGEYTHDTFEPSAVYLWHVTDPDNGRVTYVHAFLPTPADVSDFYCAHAAAIDAAVADAVLADTDDDQYERDRQEEIDNAAAMRA
jgi:hypothetical protein